MPKLFNMEPNTTEHGSQSRHKSGLGHPRIDLGEMPDRRWSHFWTGRSQGPPRARGLVKNKTTEEHLVEGLTCQGPNAPSHFIIRSSHSNISNCDFHFPLFSLDNLVSQSFPGNVLQRLRKPFPKKSDAQLSLRH